MIDVIHMVVTLILTLTIWCAIMDEPSHFKCEILS
jgi:hypothetical protein